MWVRIRVRVNPNPNRNRFFRLLGRFPPFPTFPPFSHIRAEVQTEIQKLNKAGLQTEIQNLTKLAHKLKSNHNCNYSEGCGSGKFLWKQKLEAVKGYRLRFGRSYRTSKT